MGVKNVKLEVATRLNYQTVSGEIILSSTELTAPTSDGDIEPINTTPTNKTRIETPTDNIETPTDTSNNSNNYSSDNSSNDNNNTYYPTEETNHPADNTDNYEEIKNKIDYYLAHSATDKLNSSEIEGWDDYIKTFLEENKLDQYVTSITIEDGVVVCSLTDGQEFKYNNVTSIVDLLKKLQISLTKGSEIVNA